MRVDPSSPLVDLRYHKNPAMSNRGDKLAVSLGFCVGEPLTGPHRPHYRVQISARSEHQTAVQCLRGRKMSKMIRFTVTTEAHARLSLEADRVGLALPEYTRLRVLGLLREEAPVAVREVASGPLGPRILAEMERQGWEKIATPSGVGKLARLLGSNQRAVHGALGSLVASKKLRRSIYGYHPAGVVAPENID